MPNISSVWFRHCEWRFLEIFGWNKSIKNGLLSWKMLLGKKKVMTKVDLIHNRLLSEPWIPYSSAALASKVCYSQSRGTWQIFSKTWSKSPLTPQLLMKLAISSSSNPNQIKNVLSKLEIFILQPTFQHVFVFVNQNFSIFKLPSLVKPTFPKCTSHIKSDIKSHFSLLPCRGGHLCQTSV